MNRKCTVILNSTRNMFNLINLIPLFILISSYFFRIGLDLAINLFRLIIILLIFPIINILIEIFIILKVNHKNKISILIILVNIIMFVSNYFIGLYMCSWC